MPSKEYTAKYEEYRIMVEEHLKDCLAALPDHKLKEAMGYSLLAGGKRLRPVLLLAACEMCGGDVKAALPFAAAVEMIHTYSLIHDDLPCMDNDTLRRGKPTNHVMFGEDMAVLAGDGLLSWAFEIMTAKCETAKDPVLAIRAANSIARGCGTGGMVYGQVLDIQNTGLTVKEELLKEIHYHKTGELIIGALVAGAFLASDNHDAMHAVKAYGINLGVAFQIADDVLDATQSAEVLGKTPHKDEQSGKTTYVTLYGIEGARALCREYSKKAADALGMFEDAGFLRELADAYAQRIS
ncbi:MAG: polyprenyl synthetase family protein [Clostridiales bacterium]|nr:polyprenyl synthetase family protein [Clostridiales bacterium]